MQKVQLSWSLYENEQNTIEKYCKNCRRTTLFTDTNIRRHNANGKTYTALPFINVRKIIRGIKNCVFINHLLIMWKQSICLSKDQTETTTTISITQHKESGVAEITIVLDIVFGSHRMDKALSTYISDWSRTRIVDKIKTEIFN